jgi:Fur family zinc uptake transcriptional regulator
MVTEVLLQQPAMTEAVTKSAFPPPGAPNPRRLAQSIARAMEAFASKRMRFTPLRQEVFAEIAAIPSSIGAYDILGRLAEKGTRLAPISIYRALDALLEAGVIHRLESRNAYFACRRLHQDHIPGTRPIVLVCETCGTVAEVDGEGVFENIDRAAEAAGFTPRVRFVEISGTCPRCTGEA